MKTYEKVVWSPQEKTWLYHLGIATGTLNTYRILKTLPENSRYQALESVQRALGGFSHVKSIAKFLDGLG